MKQFSLTNGGSMTAGVVMNVSKPAFWTLQRKTKLSWIRFTCLRQVDASNALIQCKADLIMSADATFNAKPPGAENLDYSAFAYRGQFCIENDGMFWDTPPMPPGTVLGYNFTLYDYGTAVLPDSYLFSLHIGYEEFDF